MLDITKSLIYIDGKERTRELDRCDWIQMLGVYQVQFSNSSNVYSYKKCKVMIMHLGYYNNSIKSLHAYFNGADIEFLIHLFGGPIDTW